MVSDYIGTLKLIREYLGMYFYIYLLEHPTKWTPTSYKWTDRPF